MLKDGILNPDIAHLFASLGHYDQIVICDAGLPVPDGVQRIDLAWKPHEPKYLDVLEEMLKHLTIEQGLLAEELKTISPRMHEKIVELLGDIPIKYVAHTELKNESAKSKAIIRTGEFTPYSSVVLVSACAY